MVKISQVHEPEAALLSADDAIQDAERLRLRFHQQKSHAVPLHTPLSVLLEAIDYLEPEALSQIVRRAEARLEVIHHSHQLS